MYLNILLKRKTEQTHNFPYNASTDIKTDKEHIHRGFKDHKGLSYSFNGSTTYSTDNKQLYQGHTKNYNSSEFNYNRNYDREYYNKFNVHPKTRPAELYTEYKNRYPNLSPNQYSIEMWQTEKGTPNQLNRVMRQDKTGRSIEQIEADDNDYAQGLAKLEETIKSKRQGMKEDKDFDDEDKEKYENDAKIIKKLAKTINPVKIKPAIEKNSKFNFDDSLVKAGEIYEKNQQKRKEQTEQNKQEFLKRSDARLKELQENKQKYKERDERTKESNEKYAEKKRAENEKLNEKRKQILEERGKKINKATKIQTIMRQKLAEKKLEEKRNAKRNSVDSVITNVGGPGVEESKDDDNKTVLYDTTPISEMRKQNEASALAILEKYEKENDDVKLENLSKEDFTKLKGMSSILGLPLNIKKLGAFRRYLKPTGKK